MLCKGAVGACDKRVLKWGKNSGNKHICLQKVVMWCHIWDFELHKLVLFVRIYLTYDHPDNTCIMYSGCQEHIVHARMWDNVSP